MTRFPDKDEDYRHSELSKQIIGAAIEVQKELRLALMRSSMKMHSVSTSQSVG
jgi:hypothetical protein